MSETRSYPRHVKIDGGVIEFRVMSRADEPAVLAFAQRLPTHDLLFLPRNISQPKVLSAWISEIERGQIKSLLAVKAGRWSAAARWCAIHIPGRRMSTRCGW